MIGQEIMSTAKTNVKVTEKKKRKKDSTYTALNKDNPRALSQKLANHSEFIDGLEVVRRSSGSFSDLLPNVSARPGFRQSDYDAFRPSEALPDKFPDIIIACQSAYKTIGIVKTMIDLMTDFSCEGLGFLHENKQQEIFYNAWAKKINLQRSVHDFTRNMLRDGNVIVRRHTARLNPKQQKDMLKISAKPDIKLTRRDEPKVLKNEIPWKYVFISPVIVQAIGGAIGSFVNERIYAIKLPKELLRTIRRPKPLEKPLLEKLPDDIVQAVKNGHDTIILPMDKTYIAHYKKDDWDTWAIPILFPVLKDLIFKSKMQLADQAALDGVINVVRIWKLGDHKEGILPKKASANKLISLLKPNVGGGAIDLVWDSMIDMEAHYPPLDKILGSEKYERVDRDIMFGLGIPEVLLGGKGANFSNAFLQFKTLIERLEYIRNEVSSWLRQEVKVIMQAKGWRIPPKIVFNRLTLRDEIAVKQLLIQLFDRNVISTESLQQSFDTDFKVELERLRREEQVRNNNPGILDRAGPFVIPPEDDKPDNPEDNGRPSGLPDKTSRERVNIKPRGSDSAEFLELLFLADELQINVDKVIDQLYLSQAGAKNIKNLKSHQKKELEDTKTYAFFNCSDVVTDIQMLFEKENDQYRYVFGEYNRELQFFMTGHGREPNVSENKKLKSFAWATIKLNEVQNEK